MLPAPSLAKIEQLMPSTNPVVLVVEDHALIRQSAVEIIRTAGFEALEAQNSDEAIKILEARPGIDLVFTDVEMPGTMDGLKLVHYIRDRWPPIRLMVASGKAIIEESQLPPGARFFSKPYAEATIVDMMIRLLNEADTEKTEQGL